MKAKWNTKYTTIAIYSFIVICCSIIFYLMASEFNSFKVKISKSLAVLNPFIIGFTIAYLLNFFLKFYEEKILDLKFFKNLKPKSKRGLGLLFTYTTVFLLLYLFFVFVFPQLTASIVGLANDIPRYINDISKSLDNFMNNLNINDEYSIHIS